MIVRVGVLALTLPTLLRLMSLPSLIAFLDSNRERKPAGTPDRDVRLVQGILGLRIGPFKPDCVRRSLILFNTLRKRGHKVRILYGVKPDPEQLDGHSWLEIDGEPLAENGDPRQTFCITYAYPAEHRTMRLSDTRGTPGNHRA